jgi:hypothetical protein
MGWPRSLSSSNPPIPGPPTHFYCNGGHEKCSTRGLRYCIVCGCSGTGVKCDGESVPQSEAFAIRQQWYKDNPR